jgi:multiple RNA-binding domain-containing protein 1
MNPAHAPKRLREDGGIPAVPAMAPPPPEDEESDGEYEEIPAKGPKNMSREVPAVAAITQQHVLPPPQTETVTTNPAPQSEEVKQVPSVDATDDDWLRSRTNRLLDLVDPDDPSFTAARSGPTADDSTHIPVTSGPTGATEDKPFPEHADPAEEEPQDGDNPETVIQKTARLFVRNLPYTATEDNLRSHFAKFGSIEEVRQQLLLESFPSRCLPFRPYDESQIGTAYTQVGT